MIVAAKESAMRPSAVARQNAAYARQAAWKGANARECCVGGAAVGGEKRQAADAVTGR